jgi:hypothetical protein
MSRCRSAVLYVDAQAAQAKDDHHHLNLGFADWGSFLKNPQLTSALNDRLTSNSHVMNMKECQSLRGKIDE